MLSVGARIIAAFKLLFTGRLPVDVLSVAAARSGRKATPASPPAPAPPAPSDDPGDRAVQLLALLQRDARLVDFLQEDLTAYSDAQVGAAARDVHGRCRAALDRYVQIEPLSAEDEGESSIVSAATDPVDDAHCRQRAGAGIGARHRAPSRLAGRRARAAAASVHQCASRGGARRSRGGIDHASALRDRHRSRHDELRAGA